MKTMPRNLAQFQRNFGRYLRDPKHSPCPVGVPLRAANVYQELIVNNIANFTNACFPICQTIISPENWQALVRDFFRQSTWQDPMFNTIPAYFVEYLYDLSCDIELPAWFAELAHYEWIELAVDTDNHKVATTNPMLLENIQSHLMTLLCSSDNNELCLEINPTLRSLHYHWPVHQISALNQPVKAKDTYLFVFRNHQHQVRFITANIPSAALISFLQETSIPAQGNLLTSFAKHIGLIEHQTLLPQLITLFSQLIAQELFIFSEK